jgi:quercetin dioxygenase-like cupin family protein
MLDARRTPVRITTVLGPILLLQTGCATDRSSPEAGTNDVVVEELVKTDRSWDGAVLPAYPQGQPEVTIVRVIISPGARLEMHSHPVINAGILVRGRLTVVTAEGKTLHLKAGDPIVEVVNTLHRGMNEGTVPAQVVVVYAGTTGTPISSSN